MKIHQDLQLEVFRQISENDVEGYMLLDNGTQAILECNNTLATICDVKPEQLNSLEQLLAFIHPDDRTHFVDQISSPFKGPKEIELRMVSQFRIKWIRCRIYRVQADSKDLIVCFMLDISVEKENNQYLLNINERKNTTLHILGHDLRNPIAAIMAANTLLARSYNSKQYEDIDTFIEIIRQYCEKSTNLINNVLDYEYIESDNVELKVVRFELSSRINLIFDTYYIGNQHNSKKFVLKASYPVYVEADEVKLMLVFENLISNAYKFTGNDGVITVELEEQADALVARVSDNGIGIPEEHFPIIFDKFTKARREGTQGEQPVGLGLNIAKRLVEMHKGTLSLESTIGKGTTFTLKIPLVHKTS